MRWTPAELAHAAAGRLLREGASPIEGAFIDSRSPRAGGLFVPIVAARDGHDFIAAAIEGGASAVLQARGRELPPGEATVVEVEDTLLALQALARAARASRATQVPAVAITGSNGKTTTRAMVEAALSSHYGSVLATQGNFNNHLGLPLSLLGEPHAPEAEVLELGMSAPGENDLLASIVQPQIGIVTSIALEHLEFMGSLEAIAKAEAEVMAHVADTGALVIPSDAPLLDAEIPAAYRPRVLRVGPDANADLRIAEVEVGERTRCVIAMPGGERVALRLQTFGAHNARNAASALAVALHLGLPFSPVVDALEAVVPVGDRGRLKSFGEHLVIADCYNANPGSMQVALESLAALRETREGPLIAVLGDMLELGPTEGALHREVGALAAKLGVDAILAYGKLGDAYVAGAAGIEGRFFAEDLDALVATLREQLAGAEPGAVLLKGSRGMRLERVLAALGI